MGGPYLESGESIILTTDRVSIDSDIFDALLTNRRLILIDNRYARFEPRIISLASVQSVRSGKSSNGDPVIMLVTREPGCGDAKTRNIVFSQEPFENRKPDRDLWVKTFIELSVSGREETVHKGSPPAGDWDGMRPSVRRWVAPEIIRPRTENFPTRDAVPEVTISPEEPEPVPVTNAISLHGNQSIQEAEDLNDRGGEDSKEYLTRVTQAAVQSIAGSGQQEVPEVRWPDIQQQSRPEPAPVTMDGKESAPGIPEQLMESSTPLSVSILAAVQSLTASGEEETGGGIPHRIPIRLTSPLPEYVGSGPIPEHLGEQTGSSQPETPGIAEHLHTFDVVVVGVRSTSPIPENPPERPLGPELPLSADADIPAEPEPISQLVQPDLPPQNDIKEPACDADEQIPVVGSAAGAGCSPPELSLPLPVIPASGIHSLLIGSGIAVCFLLVLAGVLFLPGMVSQEYGVPSVHPSAFPTMTPVVVSTPKPVSIPQEGVWIRIISPGFFTGQAGNPGSLKYISGSGDKRYPVQDSEKLVRVIAEKQEYTGDELRVEIYSDGSMITSRSTTAPAGSVDLLIDPITGKAPGLPPGIPETGNTTGSLRSQLEYL